MATVRQALRIFQSVQAHASTSSLRQSTRPIAALRRVAATRCAAPLSIPRSYATTSSDPPTSTDPSFAKALDLLDEGTRLVGEGDLDGALGKYKESVGVKPTSGGWFNLGVCEYSTGNHKAAIDAWEKSIDISPSADAYTNLASAYIMSKPPQAALAIKHLTSAMEMAPEDPEIAFNLGAILESTNNLDSALKMYERAEKGGIERAGQNIRSVSAKILTATKEAPKA